jgi:hypothetical protein
MGFSTNLRACEAKGLCGVFVWQVACLTLHADFQSTTYFSGSYMEDMQ